MIPLEDATYEVIVVDAVTVAVVDVAVTLPPLKWLQSSPVPKTALPPPPAAFWKVGALAPFDVRTWPDDPFPTWLRTPLVL